MRHALVIAVVVLAAGRPATAQDLFGSRSFVDRPDGSIGRAVEWVDAAVTHVPGERDEALQRVAGWPSAAVGEVVVEIDAIRRLMRDPDATVFLVPLDAGRRAGNEIRYSRRDREQLEGAAVRAERVGLNDADLAARGVLLHSDIAMLADGAGPILRYADGKAVNYDTAPADHWRTARTLANVLDKRDGRVADLQAWSRATLAWMLSVQNWNASNLDDALDRFGDDADVRFLAGCLHEMLAAPQLQAVRRSGVIPVDFKPRVGSATDELDEAAAQFKRARELNPQHAEARLHYGRTLTLTGRAQAAVTELRRAADETNESEHRYYARLFLGAALEAIGRHAAARDAYTSAAALFPRAQAPRLALSHLSFTTGQRREATTAIEPLLALPADEDQRHDPWWDYLVSAGRHAEQFLADARQRLATPRPKP